MTDLAASTKPAAQQNRLVATTTGELFQPVRVYYRIQDRQQLKKVFSKLKCMSFDKKGDRYVWLYIKEAQRLVFKNPLSTIPKHLQPIVIGSFFSATPKTMYLEVRSIERALAALPFFDGYFKNQGVDVTDVTIVNRLFSEREVPSDISTLFKKETRIDPDAKLKNLKSAMSKISAVTSTEDFLSQLGFAQLPDVERFPSHYAEDGIEQLEIALKNRQYVAFQHWNGNVDYSLNDLIAEAVHRVT